jgi:L-lactate dehydrogenase complex protein LldF
LLRKLREKQFEGQMRPAMEYAAFGVWAFLAKRPALYRLATGFAVRAMKWMGGSRKRIRKLPFAGGWTDTRDMPAPSGKTFRELYKQRRRP